MYTKYTKYMYTKAKSWPPPQLVIVGLTVQFLVMQCLHNPTYMYVLVVPFDHLLLVLKYLFTFDLIMLKDLTMLKWSTSYV